MNVETPIRNIVLIVREIAPTIIQGLHVQFNSLASVLCSLKTSNTNKKNEINFNNYPTFKLSLFSEFFINLKQFLNPWNIKSYDMALITFIALFSIEVICTACQTSSIKSVTFPIKTIWTALIHTVFAIWLDTFWKWKIIDYSFIIIHAVIEWQRQSEVWRALRRWVGGHSIISKDRQCSHWKLRQIIMLLIHPLSTHPPL